MIFFLISRSLNEECSFALPAMYFKKNTTNVSIKKSMPEYNVDRQGEAIPLYKAVIP